MQIPPEIITALNACHTRAYHYAHDKPRIFEDSVAHLMLSEAEAESIAERKVERLRRFDPALAASCADRSEMLSCFMRATPGPAGIVSRARYAEGKLEEAVRQGVRQYVLIGAGMDTFAFRRPDLNRHLQVFEVDREEAQRFKRQRLADINLHEPVNLHFVTVDFTRESLDAALARSKYDSSVPAFFGWLGVTPYLDQNSILNTLNSIKRGASVGSQAVFDYFDTDAFDPSRASKGMQELAENVRSGDPFVSGFNPTVLEVELSDIGFNVRENLSPLNIEARYFQDRSDGYHAMEHMHLAWAVVE